MQKQKETQLEQMGPTPELIDSLKKAAKLYIQRSLMTEINVDEDSLAFLDQYIRNIRQHELPKPEILLLVASALGVHFGEVVLQKMEGKWYGPLYENIIDSNLLPDFSSWRIELSSPPLTFAPIAMAMSALLQEDPEDWDTSISTTKELHEHVENVLSRLAPVNEEYYYSLTGRYETILYVVDILVNVTLAKEESH